MYTRFLGRLVRERFMHTSARYAADELDGSLACQTYGQNACAPLHAILVTAASVHPWTSPSGVLTGSEPSALVWGWVVGDKCKRYVERRSWTWVPERFLHEYS
ncbi:hypothetical protein [Desulfosporosinus sp. Sb-LF]|uniref:hypothetical protein n=1 Tax=Desulfosporosinus sp. Sb-LF TaxID=2560027 RepID=UPI00107F80E5|nr:hypothetical protein [Desulfosporosinus sp. Sb-LF]TGE33916.1 hypothetical protein E4K68_03660 [Desulfosporosinus sp. Sb-LF]